MTSSNLFSKLYDHLDDLPKKRALELCSGHLKGSWSSLTEDDIEVTVHEGGLLNRIFLCSNNKSKETVIIRLYGGKMPNSHMLKSIGIEGEVLIFHLMSVNRIGPKLLGVFDGGRIEEYMKGSHTLDEDDLMNNEVIACIAKKLARVHAMEVPIDKRPRDFIKCYLHEGNRCWKKFDESLDNENNLLLEAEVYDGLYDLFYRGFLTTHQKRLRKKHPGIRFGRFIVEFQERKQRIYQLLKINKGRD